MYHIELINELYPQVNRPPYKTICIDICKIVGPITIFTSLSGWIGYIIGCVHCKSDMSQSI